MTSNDQERSTPTRARVPALAPDAPETRPTTVTFWLTPAQRKRVLARLARTDRDRVRALVKLVCGRVREG